jgi:hypothetical protein
MLSISLSGEGSWSWSYDSWIYNCLCNLWVQPLFRRGELDTTLCDIVCQWLATYRWFSPGIPVSSTNITDRHGITDKLLRVSLTTIYQPCHLFYCMNTSILLLISVLWIGNIKIINNRLDIVWLLADISTIVAVSSNVMFMGIMLKN